MADSHQEHVLQDNRDRKNNNVLANNRAETIPLNRNNNIKKWNLSPSRSSTGRADQVSSTLTGGSSEKVESATANEAQHTHNEEDNQCDSSGLENEAKAATQESDTFVGCISTTEVADDMVLSECGCPEAMIGRLNLLWFEARGAHQEGDLMEARALLQGSLDVASRALEDGLYSHAKMGSYLAALGKICCDLGDNDDAVDYYKALWNPGSQCHHP